MNATLQAKCDLFAENIRTFKDAFAWDSSMISVACSALYTTRGVPADGAYLKECARILRKREGIFSEFRGHTKPFVATRMSLSGAPEAYLDDLRYVYKILRRGKFFGSEMYVLAASTILDHSDASGAEAACERAREIFNRMRREHPWLTSESDMPFAAMLSVLDVPVDVLIDDMEACFQLLRPKFHRGEALQSLSHVLSVSDLPPEEKCGRVAELFDTLKEMKHRYSRGYELAPLGALVMLDLPPEEIAYEIAEADTYLKGARGCGNLLMGADIRRMYSAMLVMNEHMPEHDLTEDARISSVIATVIALEVCMIIACSSSTSAASASSSSSH